MSPEREALESLVVALAARFGAPEMVDCSRNCAGWLDLDDCTCGAEQVAAAWGHAENLINNEEEQ